MRCLLRCVHRSAARFAIRFWECRTGSLVSDYVLTVSLCTCGAILALAAFGIRLEDVIEFAIDSLGAAFGLVD